MERETELTQKTDVSAENFWKKKTRFICPLCGGHVSELPTFYGCNNFREKDGGCQYKIFKSIYGIPIPQQMLDELLWVGETKDELCGLFDRKARENYNARLRYNKATLKVEPIRNEETEENLKEKGEI